MKSPCAGAKAPPFDKNDACPPPKLNVAGVVEKPSDGCDATAVGNMESAGFACTPPPKLNDGAAPPPNEDSLAV